MPQDLDFDNEPAVDFRRIQGNKIDQEVSSLLLGEPHEGKKTEGKEQRWDPQ